MRQEAMRALRAVFIFGSVAAFAAEPATKAVTEIGGLAIFHRALRETEMRTLAASVPLPKPAPGR